jgi:signal transduction histidine kinase
LRSTVAQRAIVICVLYAALASLLFVWARADTDAAIDQLLLNAARPPDQQSPRLAVAVTDIKRSVQLHGFLTAGAGLLALAALAAVARRGRGPTGPRSGTDHGFERSLLEAARLRGLARISLGVAHDLKAPINAIALNLANLKDALVEDGELSGPHHVETLEMLEEELRRLQRSLDLLLAQTAPVAIDAEVFSVAELLEEVEQLLRAQARQQQLTLELVTTADAPAVRGHRDWIKQAVINLVVNAFDATAEGGRVELELAERESRAVITVRDTGIGIPDDVVDRTLRSPGSTKSRGSGIGLLVARSAVETAGGQLELVRTGADGTVFEIRLPAAEGGADVG